MSTQHIKKWQQKLAAIGTYAGKIDGLFGPMTLRASEMSLAVGQPAPEPDKHAMTVMDRGAFFGQIRSKLFTSLSQRQVSWIEAILDGLTERNVPIRHAAYILATAHHESDKFRTLEEYASGAAYEGRSSLGNTQKGDGVRFKGRGFVQITGRRNYTMWAQRLGIDLVENPGLASELKHAVPILIDGMLQGTFTGKKLSDYSTYAGMRRVVNGTDRSALIAEYATTFEKALDQSGYV